MRDTTPEAEQVLLAAIRQMGPAARLRRAFEFSEWVRDLALSRLRERHPDRTDLELMELMLGRRLIPASPRPPRP